MIGLSYGNFASSGVSGFTGLLDTYPNAAAAYSVRRLSSTYTGSLIEVRRSSDNTTQDIGYDANGNLDTTALLAFVGGGDGFVRTVYGQSGNSINAQQTSASLQAPIVSAGTLLTDNGKPMIDFTGGDYYYTLSTTTTVLWSFGVQNVTAIDNIVNYIYGGNAEGCWVGGTTGSVTGWGMSANGAVREADNEALGQNIRAWSGSKLFNNGIEEGYSDTGNAGDYNLIMLGSRSDFLPFAFTGYFQEAIFYNSNQEANVTGIYTNQNDYYGVV